MFKQRRVTKKIVSGIKNNDYAIKETIKLLKIVPIRALRRIAKEAIYADYDGYNDIEKEKELYYFDSLDRQQKEFFVRQRLYKLQ